MIFMPTVTLIDPGALPYASAFLFVFALVFGLLSYSKIGEFDKKVNALIALAVAGFSILYEPLVLALTQYMPVAAAILVVLFFVALAKKVLGGGSQEMTFPLVVSLAIMLLLLSIFADRLVPFVPGGFDAGNAMWLVGILIAILFFWMIYKYKGT